MIVHNVGGATVTAQHTAPVTKAAVAPVVPGVTTVHTGEFWRGALPIVLAAGMALTGLALIARRRVVSLARAVLHTPRRGPP
jgi:hypothetical protein